MHGGGTGCIGGAGAWDANGNSGTGGLLIIYANTLNNNSVISASGIDSSEAYGSTGGASGGGSLNIFYTNSFTQNIEIANGGESKTSVGYGLKGGNGGKGTVSIDQINF